jgi:hypothetical protein
MAATKFSEFAGGWMFCGPPLLQGRIERLMALAESEAEKDLVARMVSHFWKDYQDDRVKLAQRDGESPVLAKLDAQIQTADQPRYLGPRFHGRFQIAESVVPAGTYYIVDHGLLDLLVREDGPASAIARFPTIHAAEDRVRAIIERKPMDGIGERQLKELRLKRRSAALAVTPEPAPAPEPMLEPEVPDFVASTPEPLLPRRRRHRIVEPAEGTKKRTWVSRTPKPSMSYRRLIMEGKLTDREIFAAVQKEFGVEKVPDARFANVSWYRAELRAAGKNPPAPIGYAPKPRTPAGDKRKRIRPLRAKAKAPTKELPAPKTVEPVEVAPEPVEVAPKVARAPKPARALKPARAPMVAPPKAAPPPPEAPVSRAHLESLAATVEALRAQLRALLEPRAVAPIVKPPLNLSGRMVFGPRRAS